jgi:hypothetical protein
MTEFLLAIGALTFVAGVVALVVLPDEIGYDD